MSNHRKIVVGIALGAALVVCGLWMAPKLREAMRRAHEKSEAEARSAATRRELSWGEGGPAFTVLGFDEIPKDAVPGSQHGKPAIALACRWHEAPQPWNRYDLSFPGSQVKYADGVVMSASTSPLTPKGFVIHWYFDHSPLKNEVIHGKIGCRDRSTGKDWGVQELSFAYWPGESGEHSPVTSLVVEHLAESRPQTR